MTATEALAHFGHDLTLDAHPVPVRDYAKLCILDTLDIVLAGHHEPSTRAAHSVAALAGPVLPATPVRQLPERLLALETATHLQEVLVLVCQPR